MLISAAFHDTGNANFSDLIAYPFRSMNGFAHGLTRLTAHKGDYLIFECVNQEH